MRSRGFVPYGEMRELRAEERRAAWLLVFVVLAAALATGLMEDPSDRACSPEPQRTTEPETAGWGLN